MGYSPEQLAKSGSEHGEQAALVCWAKSLKNQHPELDLLFAIPNGGDRDRITAGKLKAEGVKAGVFDLMLPVPRKGYHGLWIEMKRVNGGVVSKEQKSWGRNMVAQGYQAFICYGWLEAKSAICSYLNITGEYNKPPYYDV